MNININITEHTPEAVLKLARSLAVFGKTGEQIVAAFNRKRNVDIKEKANRATELNRRLKGWRWMSGWEMINIFACAFVLWLVFALSPWSNVNHHTSAAHLGLAAITLGIISSAFCAKLLWFRSASNECEACTEWIRQVNSLVDGWLSLDIGEVGATESAEGVIQKKLLDLALEVVMQEKAINPGPGADPGWKERYHYREVIALATDLGLSDGYMTAHFVTAERNWKRLASEGKVLTDYQI